MGTTFASVRSLERALLGDNDSRAYRYSDDALDGQTRLAIVTINDPNIAEIGSTGVFTQDLSNKDLMRVSIKASMNAVAPVPDFFSYKNPVTSVTRKGGTSFLYRHLSELLFDVESGGTKFAYSVDYSMDALVNQATRFMDSIDRALSNP